MEVCGKPVNETLPLRVSSLFVPLHADVVNVVAPFATTKLLLTIRGVETIFPYVIDPFSTATQPYF
jgi:hypothetical protein